MKPRLFLPAILSALLLWAAFFPLDLGPVAFVALVPWLTLVRAPAGWRTYLAGYAGGFVFFALATNWVRVAHPMMHLTWLALALVMPLFWVAGLWLMRRIDRVGGVPLALTVPAVWVGMEYVRAHFPTGFPALKAVGMYQMVGFGWFFLGYTQHHFLPLIQVADLGGVYAVSLVVAAVNGLACDCALRSATLRRWLRLEAGPRVALDAPPARSKPRVGLLAASIAVAALFIAAVGYGYARLAHPPFPTGPRVAAVQGSMPQGEKNQKGRSLWAMYTQLHVKAVFADPKPDLVVWPETCMPIDWAEPGPGVQLEDTSDEFRADVALAQHYFGTEDLRKDHPEYTGTKPKDKPDWKAPTLFGLTGYEWADGRAWRYNSALLVGRGGQYLGRYDKMHLVPFGEYVPFKETLPFLSAFTPYKWDYSCRPGEQWTRFAFQAADGLKYTFACLICYEDTDPYLARQYAAAEPVDFLVNISNDGWFDGTEEHEEHLAICRFRAVEARRPVVRAVNMGISAVVDGDGRVVALPAETWAGSKKVEAVVAAAVPLDGRGSWYARTGDWAPAACWVVVAVGLVAGVVTGRPRATA